MNVKAFLNLLIIAEKKQISSNSDNFNSKMLRTVDLKLCQSQ